MLRVRLARFAGLAAKLAPRTDAIARHHFNMEEKYRQKIIRVRETSWSDDPVIPPCDLTAEESALLKTSFASGWEDLRGVNVGEVEVEDSIDCLLQGLRLLNFESLPYYELPHDIDYPEDRFDVTSTFFERLLAIDRPSIPALIAIQHCVLFMLRSDRDIQADATCAVVSKRLAHLLSGRITDVESIIEACHLLVKVTQASSGNLEIVTPVTELLLAMVDEKLAAAKIVGALKDDIRKLMGAKSIKQLVEIAAASPKTEKTRIACSLINTVLGDSTPPEEAIELLEALSLSKQADNKAIEEVLSRCMILSLANLSPPQLVSLKVSEICLQVDLPGIFGSLDTQFAEYLAAIRNLEISTPIKDTVASYQIKHILKKEFKVPAKAIYIGPYPINVADKETRQVWFAWKKDERNSIQGERLVRHVTALGWNFHHFEEVAWEAITGGYEAKMKIIRDDLKMSQLIDT